MTNAIETKNAPAAIGTYSQAYRVDNLVFISGQIGMDPVSAELVSDQFTPQAEQVFKNLSAVAQASGGSLAGIAKLTVYLTDLNDFADLNLVLFNVIKTPYPARAAVEVKALPKGALIEIEAIMAIQIMQFTPTSKAPIKKAGSP